MIDHQLSAMVPDAPVIDGLTFRMYLDEADLPALLEVMNAAEVADRTFEIYTLDAGRNWLANLNDFDPSRTCSWPRSAGGSRQPRTSDEGLGFRPASASRPIVGTSETGQIWRRLSCGRGVPCG